jgi:mercuric ion transport protein
MAPRVELIFDRDCPHVGEARASLRRAFAAARLPPAWTEWERGSAASPPYARAWGSPTILVDGRDVAGAEASEGADCCRLYREGAQLAGAPSAALVAAALRRVSTP